MGRYPSRVAVLPRVSANQRSASEVSTRGITVFVPGVLASQIYEMIYDPGMGPDLSRMALAPRTPANQQSVSGVWVFTPFGEVSTRGTTVFVSGSSKLYMCGRIYDPKMRPYPPLVRRIPRTPTNQRSTSGGGVSTPCGVVPAREIIVFVRGSSESWMYGKSSDPGMESCPSRVRLDLSLIHI